MEQLFLIDGSSLLSTSFFGNLPREYFRARTNEDKAAALGKILRTSTGIPTNGVFVMTKVLTKLMLKYGPSHFAVAWDVSRDTFRRELYPAYKGTRGETPEELGVQFGVMQELLEAMNIPQFKWAEFEADDILGTLARRFEPQVPVTILTKDQDALQLITERTRVWLHTAKAKDYMGEFGMDEKSYPLPAGFFEFTPVTFRGIYGLDPIQMIDKKALEGDSSDNIPGVYGVGEKAVIPLLREFGTVERLYEHIEDLTSTEEKAMKEFMKELGVSRPPLSYLLKQPEEKGQLVGKEAALLSKKLATIVTNIPHLDSIELDHLQLAVDREGMTRKFAELEFHNLEAV